MKFLSKQCCLSLALLASMSLVGCGGGGSSSSPASPDPEISAGARAVMNSVDPILKNADSILGTSSALRAALENDARNFDKEALGNEVVKAMSVDTFMRLAVSIGGGNINYGMFCDEGNDTDSDKFYQAKYDDSTKTYEKTVYQRVDSATATAKLVANYKIVGCDATVIEGVILAITVNNGAKFEVKEDCYDENCVWNTVDGQWTPTYSYTEAFKATAEGTIAGGFSIKMEYKNQVTCTDKYLYGEKVSEIPSSCHWYFQARTKQDIVWTYSINDNFALNVSKYTYKSESGELTTSNGNMNIAISGITGNYVVTNSEISGVNMWQSSTYNNDTRQIEYGAWQESGNSGFVESSKNYDNLTLMAPVKVSVTGDFAATYTEGGSEKSTTAAIKKIEVALNDIQKYSSIPEGCAFQYYSNSADVNVELESDYATKVKLSSDDEVALKFDKANIYIKNAKLDEASCKAISKKEDYGNILLNDLLQDATVNMTGTVTEDGGKTSFTADVDVKAATAKVHVETEANHTITTDDNLKTYNFKTLDAELTKVSLTAPYYVEKDNVLTCVGVEKDGFTTTSKYTIAPTTGELKEISREDKKAPANVPTVTIDTGDLATSSIDIYHDVENAVSEVPQTDVTGGKLQATDKDGKRVAKFVSNGTDANKVESDITADKNTKVFTVAAIVGDKAYTVVFALDHKNSNKITGRIFKGVVTNATLEGGDNCIGYFASSDGNKLEMSVEGNSESVTLN